MASATDERVFANPKSDDDPDASVASGSSQMSDLQALEAEAAVAVTLDPEKYPVPGREGWKCEFDLNVDIEWLEKWKRVSNRGPKGGDERIDIANFNKLILINTCIGIYKNDRRVVGTDGNPLNFRHPEFLTATKSFDEKSAVKHWYGPDAHLAQVANAILEDAGFGDEIEREDPTMR